VERIFKNLGAFTATPASSAALARLVFNHKPAAPAAANGKES
jgi:hypothetical protein